MGGLHFRQALAGHWQALWQVFAPQSISVRNRRALPESGTVFVQIELRGLQLPEEVELRLKVLWALRFSPQGEVVAEDFWVLESPFAPQSQLALDGVISAGEYPRRHPPHRHGASPPLRTGVAAGGPFQFRPGVVGSGV